MMSAQKQQEPRRKTSRWRLGRKLSSSDNSAYPRQPQVEHDFRQGSASAQPPEAAPNHRLPQHHGHRVHGHDQSPQKEPSLKKQNKSSKQPPLPPRAKRPGQWPQSPTVPYPTQGLIPPQDAFQTQGPLPPKGPYPSPEHWQRATEDQVNEGERTLKEMMRSLSLKDDPTKFGAGTIAARRFQREELDAAMARSLFNRELATSYLGTPLEVKDDRSSLRTGGIQPPSSPINLAPLLHLKPAFTDEQWGTFKRDPLLYIQQHGLPEEPSIEVEEEDVQVMSDDFSLLPPELQQAMGESPPVSRVEEPEPPPQPKGLTHDEASAILTTFSFYDDGQAQVRDKRSRVKGRRLPKGAKPTGILSNTETSECAICLVDFEYGNKIGLLPCCHRFHSDCIVDWLQRDATCPECREDLREHIR